MGSNNIEINIKGKTYYLSRQGKREHLKMIAKYIEDTFELLISSPSAPDRNTENFAVLLAAYISNDLFKERELRDMLVNEKLSEYITKFQKNEGETSQMHDTDIVKLIDENDSLNNKVSMLNEQISEMRTELATKNADMNILKEANEKTTEQRNALKSKISEYEAIIEKYKKNLGNFHKENAFLNEQIKKSEKYVTGYADLYEKYQDVCAENKILERRNEDISEANKTLADDKKTLSQENSSLVKTNSELSAQIEKMSEYSDEIRKLQSSLDNHIKRIDSLTKENDSLKDKVSECQKNMLENEDLKNTIKEYSETINSLNNQLSETSAKLDAADKDNVLYADEIAVLKNELSHLKDVASATGTSNISDSYVKELEENLAQLKEEKEIIKQQLITAKSDLNIAKSRLGNLQVEVNKYRNSDTYKSKNKSKR